MKTVGRPDLRLRNACNCAGPSQCGRTRPGLLPLPCTRPRPAIFGRRRRRILPRRGKTHLWVHIPSRGRPPAHLGRPRRHRTRCPTRRHTAPQPGSSRRTNRPTTPRDSLPASARTRRPDSGNKMSSSSDCFATLQQRSSHRSLAAAPLTHVYISISHGTSESGSSNPSRNRDDWKQEL